MQHYDRRRPVRGRPTGKRLEALAVGGDIAANARDPLINRQMRTPPTNGVATRATSSFYWNIP
jgi:hypothetical protein